MRFRAVPQQRAHDVHLRVARRGVSTAMMDLFENSRRFGYAKSRSAILFGNQRGHVACAASAPGRRLPGRRASRPVLANKCRESRGRAREPRISIHRAILQQRCSYRSTEDPSQNNFFATSYTQRAGLHTRQISQAVNVAYGVSVKRGQERFTLSARESAC